MYIKTFKKYFLKDNTEAANKFIDSVELGDKGAVQYDNGDIVVFYSHFKKDNQSRSLNQMIEGLKDSIYNTKIRKLSLETDLMVHRKTEAAEEKIKEVEDLIKETDKNLRLYKNRLDALTNYQIM